jgi:hypothetical protein
MRGGRGWEIEAPRAPSEAGMSGSARVAAAGILLDRGWGKEPVTVAGEDGGEIKIVIRRLVDEDNAKLIEGRVLKTIDQDVKNLLEASEDPVADD